MRRRSRRIIAIQIALILITSAAASYSLPVKGVWAGLAFAGLLAVGAVMIVFPRLGPELFSLLAAITSLPAILGYNILDLGGTTYEGFQGGAVPVYANLAPELSFPVVLVLGLLLITGYLALSYLHSLQKDYRALTTGQAETAEVNDVTNRNLILIAIALIASIALAVPVILLLMTVQSTVTDYLTEMPWNILIAGLAAVFVLAGYIYWLGIRGKK